VAGTSLRQVGNSWPSGLIFRQPIPLQSSQKEIGAFKKVVVPVRAILGGSIIEPCGSSGWSIKDINTNDPVEVALAGRLQNSAMSHVAASILLKHM
jgi:hypothetical protein